MGAAAVRPIVLASLLLSGCGSDGASMAEPEPSITTTSVPTGAQSLPIGADLRAGGETIGLEMARSASEQQIGLMWRADLPTDRGMLFVVSPARTMSIWMKDTLIPLDLVFVREGTVTNVHAQVPPCSSTPCSTYASKGAVDSVIELRSGRAAELGITAGSTIDVEMR